MISVPNKCILVDPSGDFPLSLINLVKESTFLDVVIIKDISLFQKVLMKEYISLVLINMPLISQNDLDLIKTIPSKTHIIILSSYSEYAAEMYDFDNVIDFILKPFNTTRLLKAISKVMRLHLMNHPLYNKDFIFLRTGRSIKRFNFQDIDFIVALGSSTKIYHGKHFDIVNDSISVLEEVFPSSIFRRVHKSYIINIKKVTSFDTRTFSIENVVIPIGNVYRKKLGLFSKLIHLT
ncbi:LytR/AlgR family response regulator transcription factor [Flectobacillus major]|uniref:LytR/AlgR family response regulator transcription factor n=1 Tax=Flectobacillus major TaxID=103 RepID=UPI0003F56B92|nr:LytTR family DNA-binding domain-containing protein [Flectobacillus major]